MASCLMAPLHYPDPGWLIISEVLWYSSQKISQKTVNMSILDNGKKTTKLKLQSRFLGVNISFSPLSLSQHTIYSDDSRNSN